MSKRRRNRARHEFQPVLSWDESALVCGRWHCDQYQGSWLHTPKVPWWKVWNRG